MAAKAELKPSNWEVWASGEWLDSIIERLRTEQSLYVENESLPNSRRHLLVRLLDNAFMQLQGLGLGNGCHTLVLGSHGVGKTKVLTSVVRELEREAQDTPLLVQHVNLKDTITRMGSPVDIILEALDEAARAQFDAADVTTAKDRATVAVKTLEARAQCMFLVIEEVHLYWMVGTGWDLPSACRALGELYALSNSSPAIVTVTISGSVAVLRNLAFRRGDAEAIGLEYQAVYKRFTASLNSTRFQPVTLVAPRQPYAFVRVLFAAMEWYPSLSLQLDAFAAEHDMEPLLLASDDLEGMEELADPLPPIVTVAFLATGGNWRLLLTFGSNTELAAGLSAEATSGDARRVLAAISECQAANHADAIASGADATTWNSWDYMEPVAVSDVLDRSGASLKDLYQMSDQGSLTLLFTTDGRLLVGFARPRDAMLLRAESEHFEFRDMLAMLVPRGNVDEWWTAKSLATASPETTGLPASKLEWNSRELQSLRLVSRTTFLRLSAFAAKTGVEMKPASLRNKLETLSINATSARKLDAWLGEDAITTVTRQVRRAMIFEIDKWGVAIEATKVALFDETGRPRWVKETPDVWGGDLVLVERGERKDGDVEVIIHRIQVKLGGSKFGGANSTAKRNSVAIVKAKLAEGDKCVSAVVAFALDIPVDRAKTKHYLATTRELPEAEYNIVDDSFTLWGRNEMAALWHDSVRKWADCVGDTRYLKL